MKKNISTKLKAFLLLTVFSLNTVTGFACAMGVDMGFNSKHHHDDEETMETTVQAKGAIHHHHDEAGNHHDEDSEKGGCCNDKVIKFQDLDKNIVQNAIITAPEFVTILSNYFGIAIFKSPTIAPQKYIVPFFHPPPPDIRVLIRSFQI